MHACMHAYMYVVSMLDNAIYHISFIRIMTEETKLPLCNITNQNVHYPVCIRLYIEVILKSKCNR